MKHVKYLRYVIRHKWFVFVEACKLGVPFLGLVHDLSKFLPSEWRPYANYFYDYESFCPESQYHGDTRDSVPYEYTQMWLDRWFDLAWLKHQKRNKHHWQWWILREDDGGTKILDMPMKYRKEMLADWKGCGMALGKPDCASWYIANREKMLLHVNTRKWIDEELGVEQ